MSDGFSVQELIDEARQHIAYPWVEDGDALRTGRLADALHAEHARADALLEALRAVRPETHLSEEGADR